MEIFWNSTALWYGGISLFAMIAAWLGFRTARDAEVKALKRRLGEVETAKTKGERLLEDGLLEEKRARQARDAAVKDLEDSFNRIQALDTLLRDQEKLLRSRDEELKLLRSEARSPAGSRPAKVQDESGLLEELRQKSELLHAKETAVGDLERNLGGKVRALEHQLAEQENLLKSRDSELESVRAKVNTLTAQLNALGAAASQTAGLLKEEKQALREKEVAIKEQETSLRATMDALERQLGDKDRLLKTRSQELEALRSEVNILGKQSTDIGTAREIAVKELEKSLGATVNALERQLGEKEALLKRRNEELEALRCEANTLTSRLAEVGAAKDQTESLLQQELQKKTEVLQTRDAAFQELKETLSKSIEALERQLGEKEGLLKERRAELEALRARLSEGAAARNEAESLRQEVRKTKESVEAREAAVKELERGLSEKVRALEVQLAEREKLVQSRDTELGKLRSRLAEIGSARERAESLLQQELNKKIALEEAKDSTVKDLDIFRKVRTLEALLHEKEEHLKSRDGRIEKLTSELKEKRTLLAKHEREVWQAIERRSVWKHRFAKLGIPIKD
jgi:chromosome segregation ATPase